MFNPNISSSNIVSNIPPPILTMKRVSIRDFSNGNKIAIYYSDKLNQYISIPYNDIIHKEDINSEDIFKFFNNLNEENKKDFISILETNFDKAIEILKEFK